jgi:hypothetical protein
MTQRFDASLLCAHRDVLSNVVGRMQAGVPFVPTAQELKDLGDLAGAINYWATQPGACGSAPPPPTCGPDTIYTTIQWDDYTRYETRNIAPFGDNVWCIAFTIPSGTTASTVGYGSVAEYDGQPWMREMTLSRTPCDFRPADPTGANGPYQWSVGKQATIYWGVERDPIALQAGETYYFSIRNQQPTEGRILPAGFSIIWPA